MSFDEIDPDAGEAALLLLAPLVRALGAGGALKLEQMHAITRQLRSDCNTARSPEARANIAYAADMAAVFTATLHDKRELPPPVLSIATEN